MKNTIEKAINIFNYIFIGIGILIIFLVIIGFIVASNFSFLSETSSKKELIKNYTEKTNEILILKNFYNKIVPENKTVEIEYKDEKTIDIFVSNNVKPTENTKIYNLDIKSPKTDSIIKTLNWTENTFSEIKNKLDNANCISIKNGEPVNIGFRRSGLGKYFYNIFSEPVENELKNKYNDGCEYILYNEKVSLQYGSGAIGSICFPDK